jgi:transcriptional regulator GlxA family with amidase domain
VAGRACPEGASLNGSLPRTVAAVANQGVLTFDLAVPCEVFGYDRSDIVRPWYRFFVVAADPPPLRTNTGFTMDTPYRIEDLERADTIVIPGWSDTETPPSPELISALQSAYERGARLVSICIGTFVLAATGLLDGRTVTTHWRHADQLQQRFPKLKVDPRVLYVEDGRLFTSAGTAAGIDLCLHLVRLDYGYEIANTVARRIVMPPHREGSQAQYIEQPVTPEALGGGVKAACDWALRHLSVDITVKQLAREAAMSPRTFARRFREVMGLTPHDWLLRQRIRLVQRYLESTDDPVELIAEKAGFGSAATLRHHFQERLEVSPLAYRRTFRASRGPGDPRAGRGPAHL